MHDKFRIVNLQTVIHGIFNWTNATNYNKETISIDKNSATAKTFADESIKLKNTAYDDQSFGWGKDTNSILSRYKDLFCCASTLSNIDNGNSN